MNEKHSYLENEEGKKLFKIFLNFFDEKREKHIS